MTCLAAQKSCLINEVLPLFPTDKALNNFSSPLLLVSLLVCMCGTISLVKVFSASPRHGAEMPSQSHPQLCLLTVCVTSSACPNSREKKKQFLFLTDPIIFICSASTHPLPKKLLKTDPTAKLCHQCVPSRAFAAVLTSQVLRCLSQPSSVQPAAAEPRAPCAGQGQLPLPPALLFLTYDMN